MEKDRVKCVCLAFAASVVQRLENPGAKLELDILFEELYDIFSEDDSEPGQKSDKVKRIINESK